MVVVVESCRESLRIMGGSSELALAWLDWESGRGVAMDCSADDMVRRRDAAGSL